MWDNALIALVLGAGVIIGMSLGVIIDTIIKDHQIRKARAKKHE